MAIRFRPYRRLIIVGSVFLRNVANLIDGVGVGFKIIKVRLTAALMGERRREFSAKYNLYRRTNNANQDSNGANSIAAAMFRRLFVGFSVDFARAVSRKIILLTLNVRRLGHAAFFNRLCK